MIRSITYVATVLLFYMDRCDFAALAASAGVAVYMGRRFALDELVIEEERS